MFPVKQTPVSDLSRLIDAHLPVNRHGLAVVMYHVHQDDNPFHRMQGGEKPDYNAAIRVSVTAARHVHPGALIVMLTDDVTIFDADLPMLVIRLPVVKPWLMYERTRCQLAFTEVWAGHALHVDTDVVLRKSFDPVFNLHIDFALTGRIEIPGQHINGGMLICRTPKCFAHFLEDLIAMYDAVADAAKSWAPFDLRCFRGGQLSLAVLMFDRFIGRYPTPWGRMEIIDARLVNWTYDPNKVATEGAAAFAWQYKGYRKRYLPKTEIQPAA